MLHVTFIYIFFSPSFSITFTKRIQVNLEEENLYWSNLEVSLSLSLILFKPYIKYKKIKTNLNLIFRTAHCSWQILYLSFNWCWPTRMQISSHLLLAVHSLNFNKLFNNDIFLIKYWNFVARFIDWTSLVMLSSMLFCTGSWIKSVKKSQFTV
jgi:hypothetical protein